MNIFWKWSRVLLEIWPDCQPVSFVFYFSVFLFSLWSSFWKYSSSDWKCDWRSWWRFQGIQLCLFLFLFFFLFMIAVWHLWVQEPLSTLQFQKWNPWYARTSADLSIQFDTINFHLSVFWFFIYLFYLFIYLSICFLSVC